MNDSPFLQIKSLETEVVGKLRGIDMFALGKVEQKLLEKLRRDVVDARLDIRDYELSETRDEQLKKVKAGKRQLDNMRQGILAASEYDIFSAIDVAQLTARLEQISENLR